MSNKKCVKLGRIRLVIALADHWAVKAGEIWYEITTDTSEIDGKNIVRKSRGNSAASGADESRGELVGETDKNENQIEQWIKKWLCTNVKYDLFDDNCQKFALEFIEYLTDGNSMVSLRPDSALQGRAAGSRTFVCADDGNAIAAVESGRVEGSLGYMNARMAGPAAKIQSVDGPGYGTFGEAHLGRVEVSLGRLAGAHFSPNVNTGLGVRNGNAELHVLGFGGKIGADGVQVNTPLGGANAGCCVM